MENSLGLFEKNTTVMDVDLQPCSSSKYEFSRYLLEVSRIFGELKVKILRRTRMSCSRGLIDEVSRDFKKWGDSVKAGGRFEIKRADITHSSTKLKRSHLDLSHIFLQ
jgi:hypothetical protein